MIRRWTKSAHIYFNRNMNLRCFAIRSLRLRWVESFIRDTNDSEKPKPKVNGSLEWELPNKNTNETLAEVVRLCRCCHISLCRHLVKRVYSSLSLHLFISQLHFQHTVPLIVVCASINRFCAFLFKLMYISECVAAEWKFLSNNRIRFTNLTVPNICPRRVARSFPVWRLLCSYRSCVVAMKYECYHATVEAVTTTK